MITFEALKDNNDIQELIKSTFDMDLAIFGGWGYTQDDATIIEALSEGMPLKQLQHMLTSIRAHLEMNITQTPENRYGGINANERSREEHKIQKNIYDEVHYEITAMKEDLYTAFIKEYKAGYGNETFDLSEHFQRRKEATLTREIVHYFEVSRTK